MRKTPDITVRGYVVGDPLTYEVPSKDAGELLIDQAFYAAFQVDDVNAAQSDLNLVSMFAEDAAAKVKIAVDTEVLAYIATRAAAANKGNTAGAISGNIALGAISGAGASVSITSDTAIDKIVDLNQVLDEQNIDPQGRWIILPAWYAALLKKGDLKSADITGDTTGVIRNGMIGMIDGMTVYKSNNLYKATDGDAANSWYVMAGHKEACTFASQVDKVDTLQIPTSFGSYWRTLFVYGRAVAQSVALASLICKKG